MSQSSNATGTVNVALHAFGRAPGSTTLHGFHLVSSPSASSAVILSGLSKACVGETAATGTPPTLFAHAAVMTASKDSPIARIHRDIAVPPGSSLLPRMPPNGPTAV